MKPKLIFSTAFISAVILSACNSGSNKTNETTTTPNASENSATKSDTAASTAGNEKKGVGKFQHVELTHPLDQKMIAAGKGVYELKCASCHKLTDEKLVGPGWKGVTDRRTPEWIMNFVTNTEEMLEKNQEAKNLYEVCLENA